MITCQQLTDLVTDYLEGRLTLRQRLAFQVHLGICPSCRTYLKQVQGTVRITGRLPPEPMPAEVQAELLQRFRAWHAQPPDGADALPRDDDTPEKP